MKTTSRAIAVACGVILAVAACQPPAASSGAGVSAVPSAQGSNEPSPSANASPSAASGLVYYLAPALSDEFQAGSKLLIEKLGKDLGYDVRTLNANSQATTQVNQLDDVISQHPKAIIVAAVDASTILTGVAKARAAGIPVLVYDRTIKDAPVDFTSVTGTVKLGEIAAGEVGRLLTAKNGQPKGKVLEVLGDLGDGYTVGINQGFSAAMASQFPNVQVIVKDSPGWTPEAAAQHVENTLTANPDLDLIFLHGDFRTSAIVAALQGRGVKKGSILMIGTDGAPTGLAAIRDGWLTETVQQPMPQQVAGLWKYLPDLLAKNAIAAGPTDVGGLASELKQETWGPTLYLPGQVIDSKNVDDPSLWGNLKVVTEQ